MGAVRSGLTLGGFYAAVAVGVGAISFISLSSTHLADASISRCVSLAADTPGLKAPPSVLSYSFGKGLLWPLSLYDEVINKNHSLGEWVIAGYDPFNSKCD